MRREERAFIEIHWQQTTQRPAILFLGNQHLGADVGSEQMEVCCTKSRLLRTIPQRRALTALTQTQSAGSLEFILRLTTLIQSLFRLTMVQLTFVMSIALVQLALLAQTSVGLPIEHVLFRSFVNLLI